MNENLFVGVYPTGLVFADKTKEKNGDYLTLAYVNYASLELEWRVKKLSPELKKEIEAMHKDLLSKKGERYSVSSSGQYVILGSGIK